MNATLRRYRWTYGLTDVSVLQRYAESFSMVIAKLR
jgi:hypothetical protein